MENNNLIELIDKYVHNQLIDKEKNDFEARMQTDKELQTDVKLYKGMISGLKKRAQNIDDSIRKAVEELPAPHSNIVSFFETYKAHLSIAGSVLLVFLLSYLILNNSSPKGNSDSNLAVNDTSKSNLSKIVDSNLSRKTQPLAYEEKDIKNTPQKGQETKPKTEKNLAKNALLQDTKNIQVMGYNISQATQKVEYSILINKGEILKKIINRISLYIPPSYGKVSSISLYAKDKEHLFDDSFLLVPNQDNLYSTDTEQLPANDYIIDIKLSNGTILEHNFKVE